MEANEAASTTLTGSLDKQDNFDLKHYLEQPCQQCVGPILQICNIRCCDSHEQKTGYENTMQLILPQTYKKGLLQYFLY